MLARFGSPAPRSLARAAIRCMSSSAARPELTQVDKLTDLGTRRIFNEEHDQFRDSVRSWWNTNVVPFHKEWEDVGMVPRELWKQAGEHGLLGVTMPEEYGGMGTDIMYSAITWEEQAYTGCTGPGFALHSEIVMPYILNYGTEEQKKRLLPAMAEGELIGAIAMTEPGAGSDLQGIRTRAVPDGDDFILDGSKVFITNGQLADVVIVVAKTDADKGAHGISLFLVERGMKGFERGKNLKKMGMKAQDTSELFFDSVRVPRANLLGKLNHGFYMLMQELPQERLIIADMAAAGAEACYEWTREYVNDRKAFGGPLSKMQTVRHRLARLKTEIVATRAFTDQCLELHAEHRLDNEMASMAKAWCSEVQNKVADECVQLHGGWGYMFEYAVCRAYVDARVQPIYGGSNEIMMELVSRSIAPRK